MNTELVQYKVKLLTQYLNNNNNNTNQNMTNANNIYDPYDTPSFVYAIPPACTHHLSLSFDCKQLKESIPHVSIINNQSKSTEWKTYKQTYEAKCRKDRAEYSFIVDSDNTDQQQYNANQWNQINQFITQQEASSIDSILKHEPVHSLLLTSNYDLPMKGLLMEIPSKTISYWTQQPCMPSDCFKPIYLDPRYIQQSIYFQNQIKQYTNRFDTIEIQIYEKSSISTVSCQGYYIQAFLLALTSLTSKGTIYIGIHDILYDAWFQQWILLFLFLFSNISIEALRDVPYLILSEMNTDDELYRQIYQTVLLCQLNKPTTTSVVSFSNLSDSFKEKMASILTMIHKWKCRYYEWKQQLMQTYSFYKGPMHLLMNYKHTCNYQSNHRHINLALDQKQDQGQDQVMTSSTSPSNFCLCSMNKEMYFFYIDLNSCTWNRELVTRTDSIIPWPTINNAKNIAVMLGYVLNGNQIYILDIQNSPYYHPPKKIISILKSNPFQNNNMYIYIIYANCNYYLHPEQIYKSKSESVFAHYHLVYSHSLDAVLLNSVDSCF